MLSSCSMPSKPEIFTVWLFTEKIANSCSRRMVFLNKKKAKYISKRISYYRFKLDIPSAIDATEGVTVQEHFFIQTASFTFSGFSWFGVLSSQSLGRPQNCILHVGRGASSTWISRLFFVSLSGFQAFSPFLISSPGLASSFLACNTFS